MTKAYDKVQYDILLNKLYDLGIRGSVHKWFDSYLTYRKQYVEITHYNSKSGEITNIRSDVEYINSSIPQGSVLGCILFLLYINDLPKTVQDPCVLFADDISIQTPCDDIRNLNSKLYGILHEVKSWLSDHNLEINFQKTKIMQFRPYQKSPLNINFAFNGINLECVDTFTLLGIDIDCNINWKSHVQKVKTKLSKFTYALRELKKSTGIDAALLAYYSYANAWLSYGVVLWGNSTNAQELFLIQKKCIRILKNVKNRESCLPHFKSLKILTLPCIYILEAAKFVRKQPQNFAKLEDVPRRYQLRPTRKYNLLQPSSNLKLHSTGPKSMCEKIYNQIPNHIKAIESNTAFISSLKKFLLNKAFYKVDDFFKE